MSETTGRLLAVLAALQSRPAWSGPELADRLGVTIRTIRRDAERLRVLGYPVESMRGPDGGYRLGVGGAAVPPLMLDPDEAFALATLVRLGTSGDVDPSAEAGIGEAAQRGLRKLEAMLPRNFRDQIELAANVIRVAGATDPIEGDILRMISAACRERDELAVVYRDRNGRVTERRLHPYRVVSIGRRWYLVARDARHADWRTWRVDRVESARRTGHRFVVGDPPDAVELVQRSISTSPYHYQARVEVSMPVDELARRVPPTVGVIEAVDDETSLLTTGADQLDSLALHVAMLGAPFRVLEPVELRGAIVRLAERLRRGAET